MKCCATPVLIIALALVAATPAGAAEVPIVYSSDLFHPHDDPDDHYDLACLFAIGEFDIKGVVLDMGEKQAKRIGRPPVEQMIKITGRQVPYAVGLHRPFRTRTDTGLDAPERFQAAVEMILAVLRESKEKVTLFTTGSVRDVAAAYNRQPELMKQKVRAVYFNIGRGPNERQREWNVKLDPRAYLRLFESGLPLYWCPCFGRDGYGTHYKVNQTTVVGACTPPVQNFFVYCLTKSPADPIAFLESGPHPLPTGKRNMWCTAPMFHAAGREIYRRGEDDYVALPPEEAKRQDLAGKQIEAYRFVPMRATVVDPRPSPPDGEPTDAGRGGQLRVELDAAAPNGYVFRITNPNYPQIMASCLKNLLAGLGR